MTATNFAQETEEMIENSSIPRSLIHSSTSVFSRKRKERRVQLDTMYSTVDGAVATLTLNRGKAKRVIDERA